jgi:hypothetical protein
MPVIWANDLPAVVNDFDAIESGLSTTPGG